MYVHSLPTQENTFHNDKQRKALQKENLHAENQLQVDLQKGTIQLKIRNSINYPNNIQTHVVTQEEKDYKWCHYNKLLKQIKIQWYPYLDEIEMYTHIKLL